jgi:hypothetical protein
MLHIWNAMAKMIELMKSPKEMTAWFSEKEANFNALAKNNFHTSLP